MTIPSAARVSARTASRAQRWFVAVDGHRLRQLRRQQRLSQEALASRAGISVGTVGQLERQARTSYAGVALWPGSPPRWVRTPPLLWPIDAPPGVAVQECGNLRHRMAADAIENHP